MFKPFFKTISMVAILIWISPAHAIEVEEAGVEKGFEFETESFYTDKNADGNYEYGTEYEFAIGITDWLRIAFEIELEEEENESPYRLTEWGFNTIIELIDPEANAIGISLYAGIEHERGSDGEGGDNEVFIGAIVEKKIQQLTLRTNLLYVTDLNEADETFEGFDGFYQAVYNVSDNFGVGVEGYYSHRDPDEAGEPTTETHLVGPVVYYQGGFVQDMLNSVFNRRRTISIKGNDHNENGDDDDEGVEVSGNFGVLFGTNNETADYVIKWNSEIEF